MGVYTLNEEWARGYREEALEHLRNAHRALKNLNDTVTALDAKFCDEYVAKATKALKRTTKTIRALEN